MDLKKTVPSFSPAPKKKNTPRQINDNIIESLRGVGSQVGKTLTKDTLGPMGETALQSIFGRVAKKGELRPNESLDFRRERKPVLQPRRNYEREILQAKQKEAVVQKQIDAVRMELKELAKSLRSLL